MENSVKAKTPLFFQDALAKEIEKITADMRFIAPKTKEMVQMKAFSQSLPIKEYSEGNEENNEYSGSFDYDSEQMNDPIFKCPWCVVKIEGGDIPGINEWQTIQVAICFGIFNEDPRNQGHREILNLIQKVYSRFAVDPILDSQYTCSGEFEWAIQDEDTYPYFFGAISTNFKFAGYRRENKFL